jgi:spore coat polysaccharide biosynthesis predicted glycosyltransferase SpsG
MNRDPILFRVDATPRTGWERMNRCMVYAAALQRRRRPAYFLSQLDPGHFGLNLKRAGNEWLDASAPAGTEDDVTETVQEIRRLSPAAIVVDSAEAQENYLAELCGTGVLVVSIDHLATVRFPSQLVINPLLGLSVNEYEYAPGTQFLSGRRYAFVRPSVRRMRQLRAQEPLTSFRALIAVSDDDDKDATPTLTKMLLAVTRLERIDVVARADSPVIDELRALAEEHAPRLDIVTEPGEVPSRITRCHFAISRGDACSLELACVGIPQIIATVSEAHLPTARKLDDDGAAMNLGSWNQITASQLRQAVQDLLSDPYERQTMSRCGRKLIDGRGPDRLVTALEVMLHPSSLAEMNEAA